MSTTLIATSASAPTLRPPILTACPVCSGELQATKNQFLNHVHVTHEGKIVDSQDSLLSEDDDYHVYCENDHSWTEMQKALQLGTRVCPGCDEEMASTDSASAQGYCEDCEAIRQSGVRAPENAASEPCDDYWKRLHAEARAHDWSGFTRQIIGRTPGTHTYRVTKSAASPWPSRFLLATWCEDFGQNFGQELRTLDQNTVDVDIYVD